MRRFLFSIGILSLALFMLTGCGEGEQKCDGIAQCNGDNEIMDCMTKLVETCEGPNTCMEFDDFAVCAVHESCEEGNWGFCSDNAQLGCSTDSRKPTVSVVKATSCREGTTCTDKEPHGIGTTCE
ncbi:MAG: hypothetical protein ACNA8W_26215 [Bradymonadaceae bacterium]